MKTHPSKKSLFDKRVADGIPIVEEIANRLRRRLPCHVEQSELIGAGKLRLVECAQRFDKKRGVEFVAYIRRSVRGAMLDHLRSLDILPHRVRKSIKNGSNQNETLGRLTSIDTDETSQDIFQRMESSDEPLDLSLQKKELIELLFPKIDELPERSQLILSLIYVEDMKLYEVADILKIHRTRVSRLHREALSFLRSALTR